MLPATGIPTVNHSRNEVTRAEENIPQIWSEHKLQYNYRRDSFAITFCQ